MAAIMSNQNRNEVELGKSVDEEKQLSRRKAIRTLSTGIAGAGLIGIGGTKVTSAISSPVWTESQSALVRGEGTNQSYDHFRDIQAVLTYRGQDEAFGEIVHQFGISMISHTFFGYEDADYTIVRDNPEWAQEGSRIEVDHYADSFWNEDSLTFGGYISPDTTPSWEDIIKNDDQSVEDFERQVEKNLEENNNDDIAGQLVKWAATTALDEFKHRLGSAVQLADILFGNEQNPESCDSNVNGDGWEWCLPGSFPLNFQNASFEFRYEKDNQDHTATIKQEVIQDYEPYDTDFEYNTNPMEWELTLPAYESDAEVEVIR